MEALVNTREYPAQRVYVIDEDSKVGEARRAAQALADFEFDSQTAGRVALATTELANNLLRHAGGGELMMQILGGDETCTLELLALDRGPGMRDVARCLSDGYSTGGTPGTGLGAVRRLSDAFDIHSAPGEGTVVMARFGAEPAMRYGAVCVAMPGEIECGDTWRLVGNRDLATILVVDGLGHGCFAAEAARSGAEAFAAKPFDAPHEILQRAGLAMSRTRGGAAACAQIRADGSLSYAGIGNISGAIASAEKFQGLVSHAGTLGMAGRRPQTFEYQRAPGSLLIMHSDGVSARWNLKHRPGLSACHPAIIAAALYRDHGRNRDDATVLVVA